MNNTIIHGYGLQTAQDIKAWTLMDTEGCVGWTKLIQSMRDIWLGEELSRPPCITDMIDEEDEAWLDRNSGWKAKCGLSVTVGDIDPESDDDWFSVTVMEASDVVSDASLRWGQQEDSIGQLDDEAAEWLRNNEHHLVCNTDKVIVEFTRAKFRVNGACAAQRQQSANQSAYDKANNRVPLIHPYQDRVYRMFEAACDVKFPVPKDIDLWESQTGRQYEGGIGGKRSFDIRVPFKNPRAYNMFIQFPHPGPFRDIISGARAWLRDMIQYDDIIPRITARNGKLYIGNQRVRDTKETVSTRWLSTSPEAHRAEYGLDLSDQAMHVLEVDLPAVVWHALIRQAYPELTRMAERILAKTYQESENDTFAIALDRVWSSEIMMLMRKPSCDEDRNEKATSLKVRMVIDMMTNVPALRFYGKVADKVWKIATEV